MLTLSQCLHVLKKNDSIPIDRVCDASSLGVPLGVREVLFLIGFQCILCACSRQYEMNTVEHLMVVRGMTNKPLGCSRDALFFC